MSLIKMDRQFITIFFSILTVETVKICVAIYLEFMTFKFKNLVNFLTARSQSKFIDSNILLYDLNVKYLYNTNL